MQIALFTIWHVKNYGAELQTYATIRALEALGHTVTVIDYRPYNKNIKQKIANIIINLTPAHYNFIKFWAKYISNKTIRYNSLKQLRERPPKADMYIVGSDQVWNIDITKEHYLAYFLDFGDISIPKISYASSIGENNWKWTNLTNIIKSKLDKFRNISCRESTGVKILKEQFDIEAELVLDPTLLHTSYPELTGAVHERNTLVYYPLNKYDDEFKYRNLARELNLIYLNTNKRKMISRTIAWSRTSIIDWVKNIASAKFVVTPSFHGLAFSLIYHRQFAIIGTNSSRNSRISDLLNSLGIADRYFDSFEKFYESKIWEYPIDYQLIDYRLNILRDKSWHYLENI